MPQMMPINWIISFIMFIFIFILFNILNYYIFISKMKISPNNINYKKKINYWKW